LVFSDKLTHEGQKELCDARHESSWIGCAGIITVSTRSGTNLEGDSDWLWPCFLFLPTLTL
ncbi:Citrinin biosynthesis transcriptional activator ctnR, partial [Fusarium oxysporum f. sp. albedinis]